MAYFLTSFLASIQAFMLAFYLASTPTFYPAFYRASILTFFLAFYLRHVLTSIWQCVRVQECSTASGDRDMTHNSWNPQSWRAARGAHQEQRRRSRSRRTSRRKKKKKNKKEEGVAPLLKSGGPHLAGGNHLHKSLFFMLQTAINIQKSTNHMATFHHLLHTTSSLLWFPQRPSLRLLEAAIRPDADLWPVRPGQLEKGRDSYPSWA